MPYLNSLPFFRGLTLKEPYGFTDCVPRELGRRAAAGELVAGLLPLVDCFRLQATFERLGPFGIAVRGRAQSAILFARRPIRQLDGATISITEESSTTACLLRLILEARYGVAPATYRRGRHPDAEALLLIGDEAIRFRQANAQYPFETDVAFEWWLWQHLPFVFAVWAIRKDAPQPDKKQLELAIAGSLAANLSRLDAVSQEQAPAFGLTAQDIQSYLSAFLYRLSQPEEAAIRRFRELLDEHHLL